jgi:hypothetical protein
MQQCQVLTSSRGSATFSLTADSFRRRRAALQQRIDESSVRAVLTDAMQDMRIPDSCL